MIFIDEEVFLAKGVRIHAGRKDVLVESEIIGVLADDGGLKWASEG